MTIRTAVPFLLLASAFALAACQPSTDNATTDAPVDAIDEPSVPTPVAEPERDPLLEGSDATSVVHHDRADPTGFDRKAFAGRFSGTLPCADCPGIDTRLEIAEGGTFALGETRLGGDARHDTAGTWTVDAAGKRLLLDPDVKDAADRHFEVVSNDELRVVDADGNPVDGAVGPGLRRD